MNIENAAINCGAKGAVVIINQAEANTTVQTQTVYSGVLGSGGDNSEFLLRATLVLNPHLLGAGTLDGALTRIKITHVYGCDEYYTLAELAGKQRSIVIGANAYIAIERKTSSGTKLIACTIYLEPI